MRAALLHQHTIGERDHEIASALHHRIAGAG